MADGLFGVPKTSWFWPRRNDKSGKVLFSRLLEIRWPAQLRRYGAPGHVRVRDGHI